MEKTTLSRAEKLDRIFGTPVYAVLLAIFCNVLWGSAFPFIKMGYRLFSIDSGNTWCLKSLNCPTFPSPPT